VHYKSNKAESEENETTYNPFEYVNLFNKGFEKAVEVSKSSLDLAVEQNAEVLDAYKKTMKPYGMPGLFWFDLAGQAFEGFVKLQKNLLDLAVEQNAAFAEAVKESNKAKNSLIQQSINRTVEVQKSVANFASNQAKAVSDTLKQQPGIAGTSFEAVADSVQCGVDTVLTSQTEMLDIARKAAKSGEAK